MSRRGTLLHFLLRARAEHLAEVVHHGVGLLLLLPPVVISIPPGHFLVYVLHLGVYQPLGHLCSHVSCLLVLVLVLFSLLFSSALLRLAKASDRHHLNPHNGSPAAAAAGHLARHLPLALAEKSPFRRSAEKYYY